MRYIFTLFIIVGLGGVAYIYTNNSTPAESPIDNAQVTSDTSTDNEPNTTPTSGDNSNVASGGGIQCEITRNDLYSNTNSTISLFIDTASADTYIHMIDQDTESHIWYLESGMYTHSQEADGKPSGYFASQENSDVYGEAINSQSMIYRFTQRQLQDLRSPAAFERAIVANTNEQDALVSCDWWTVNAATLQPDQTVDYLDLGEYYNL